jgi:hypothetical protein
MGQDILVSTTTQRDGSYPKRESARNRKRKEKKRKEKEKQEKRKRKERKERFYIIVEPQNWG